MEYRTFGQTGMNLSVMGLGGLLARYEGALGRASDAELREIYLRAVELGVNLFDMGYGYEVHIPDELKGNRNDLHFSLKVGAPPADTLAGTVEKHLNNLRRDRIDILRVHHYAYVGDDNLREVIARLKQAGKVRSLCLIRHFPADQTAYDERGCEPGADADLVIYNYVCRYQEAGLQRSRQQGKGVLIMKALGGQWIGWEEQTTADWSAGDETQVLKLAAAPDNVRNDLGLIYPIVKGNWRGLCASGEIVPRTANAIQWVLQNPAVHSVLVAVADVNELEQACQQGVAREQ
jgi:aryl-alcohol dehydrogenase-like predicted oxidoreductase